MMLMVKLEKIVLQGFKSFKRKVSIPLADGVSVFTGPNGSGKSCLSDSISFVIGKSSSRTLRARTSKDLIFHGSKNKSASDFANVILYLDNRKKELPLNEPTVTISRKINKKGISTYRLNGKIITRQQMVDILSQAGIRPDGHNIIQQGEVNQIVEMDSIERREILDEISGIMEYDDKKAKAEKELAKVEEKIKEAEIILQQKGEVMEKLNKERNAALNYKNLERLLSDIKYAIVYKRFSECKESLEDVNKRLEEKTKKLEKLEEEIKKMDKEIESEEEKLEQLTKEIMKASDRIEATKKLAKLSSEIETKKERIESNKRQIERINELIERLGGTESPSFKEIINMEGVFGKVSALISVPEKYSVAVEVAAGGHLNDIVVDTADTAVKCIKYLKNRKIGRARFLPLDKIQYFSKPVPSGTKMLSELIEYDNKYENVMRYVFGSTACVDNIDIAKNIARNNKIRLVTLDGDLIETSGAMTGGFYRKKGMAPTGKYVEEKNRLKKEIEELEAELIKLNNEMEKLASEEQKTETISFEKTRIKSDEKLKKTREKRKEMYEKRLILQQQIGKLNIRRARLEADFDNSRVQLESIEDEKKINNNIKKLVEKKVSVLKQMERDALEKLKEIGPVNLKALEDFDNLKEEFDVFREKVDKIVSERESILKTIERIEARRRETFMKTLTEIKRNFKEVYKELTGGDAELELENPDDINTGLLIKAQPPNKKLLHIDSMSGGEKTLTAFAFLFAIQRHKSSPFYILDEADATLDKRNTKKVAELIKKHAKFAQFILITHNDDMVREADQIYGVTMEDGESKIIGIKLPENN